jgi:hypothetical protein
MLTYNDKRRERYQERKENGCCPRCGKQLNNFKYISCLACRRHYAMYSSKNFPELNILRQKRYRMRIANKQCPRCGVKHSKGFKRKLCIRCVQQLIDYRK